MALEHRTEQNTKTCLTSEHRTEQNTNILLFFHPWSKGIGIIFKPREYGEYLVNVKQGAKHIQRSPFYVVVYDEEEFFDSSKVKVHGVGRFVHTMKLTEFFIDTKLAGFGRLESSIQGPSKVLC